ncbi:MAG: hypothetical protein CK550_05230 [Gemmatimonadetes bacterium]|nr:MAG: hypothetical protein CK550_05230 [Gemmatimonadota bacterium]
MSETRNRPNPTDLRLATHRPRRTRTRLVLAAIALALAAFAGLVWGPGRGVGTDDTVRNVAVPSHAPWSPTWRERLAPVSDRDERVRFGLLGGTGLVALLLLLASRRAIRPPTSGCE